MAPTPPPETFITDAARVVCDGDEDGRLPADGHPRVWLQLGSDGEANCGYCDRRFILAGSPADKR